MSLRPPRPPSSRTGFETPANLLDYEIAQEKAAALGRLGRALEKALVALREFDAEAREASPEQRKARRMLVAEAGSALWHFIVQREACGLRDARAVMRDYRVPVEVQDGMGAFPARSTSR
jgi:uncharacterized protein DUF6665